MNRETAINVVKRAIAQKYGTQKAAAKALGISELTISRVMTGYTQPISPELLEMAGLVAVVPETTYKRVGK